MFTVTLRTKFLLSLILISMLLTTGVLVIVRYRVQLRVRDELTQSLDTSVATFGRLQQLRELTLERSASLLAALPPLKALMTSGDPATIQDASATFWELAGSQVFVLADRTGRVSAFHASSPEFPPAAAQAAIARYLQTGNTRDWWFGGGHLFQVFLQPISAGTAATNYPLGLLAVGYEVDAGVAADVARVAAGDVAFAYDGTLVVSTGPVSLRAGLTRLVAGTTAETTVPVDLRIGDGAFLVTTVPLTRPPAPAITLTVLKSLDESAAFLRNLNRWILAVGAAGLVAGTVLAFVVSTTFTRPLARLVAGVHALEQGDFAYPLDLRGRDEVAALTGAFSRMRERLQATQRQLLETERLATIGRMANTISHDLRHPLTAIQAYAEYLAERDLPEAVRKDFHQEIRIAVNRMTDEINSLLGFSHERQALQKVDTRLEDLVDRAVKTVKALPEFQHIAITSSCVPGTVVTLDPAKVERVLLNLLFNAAEAVSPESGRVEVGARSRGDAVEVWVTDNGPGISGAIIDSLFQPFVSHGKQTGTGLGLTVVQNVMQQHGGDVRVERTGAEGTTFVLRFPRVAADAQISS